ncbi:glycosyltransferase [Streptococcus pluranimalium]
MEENYVKYKDFIKNHFEMTREGLNSDIDSIFENSSQIKKILDESKFLTIGIGILVKNQEKNIPHVIESVVNISDSITIVDTGSTDHTIDVIKGLQEKYNISLKSYPWEENYSKMRNLVADYIEEDWIFFIDSDELLQNDIDINILKFSLIFFEKLFKSDELVFCFRQKGIGMNGIGYPQRLYKNNKKLKFYGFVHEEIRSLNLIELKTNFTLLNLGTDEKEVSKFNKVHRYDNLLLKNIKLEPDNIKWFALLSKEWMLNNLDEFTSQQSHFINEIKKNSAMNDFFSMKVYITFINFLILEEQSSELINSEIEFAKNRFSHNPIFYYFEYYVNILKIDNEVKKLIQKLREDIKTISSHSKSEWDILFQFETIECVLIKLLMKSSNYQLAYNIYNNKKLELEKTGLLESEIEFFESVNN